MCSTGNSIFLSLRLFRERRLSGSMNNVVCRGLRPCSQSDGDVVTTDKKAGAKARSKDLQVRDVWARSQLLVEVLLTFMEREIRSRDKERSEKWLKLFGSKDSAVVNLQKLVQVLGELQEQTPVAQAKDQPQTAAPVNAQELALLQDWLKSVSATSASTATE